MYKHILVPLDCSPFSEEALPYARVLAQQIGARLTLVSVLEPLNSAAAEWAPHMREMMREVHSTNYRSALDYLEALQAELGAEGIHVETRLVEAAGVAQALLDAAKAADVDLIVMTTHGRSGLQRWVLGSVAERIVRQSPVPVLLLRIDEDRLLPKPPHADVQTSVLEK